MSIENNWKNSCIYHTAVNYENVLEWNPKCYGHRLLMGTFEFLDCYRPATTVAVLVSSPTESYEFPLVVIDFTTLVPLDLDDQELINSVLHQYHDSTLDALWKKGVISCTAALRNRIPLVLESLEIKECKDEVERLASTLNFYPSIIGLKVREGDQEGIALRSDEKSTLLGFALYSVLTVDEEKRTVLLHIEYVLVSSQSPCKGIGSNLSHQVIQRVQSKYAAYAIKAYAEAKPTPQALGFWLNKMQFSVDDKRCIEGVYYPCFRVYDAAVHGDSEKLVAQAVVEE